MHAQWSRDRGGPPFILQMMQQAVLRYRFDHSPEGYYLFSLDRHPQDAGLYIDHQMLADLQKYLAARCYPWECEQLEDKVRFHRLCLINNLDTIPVLAEFENGSVYWPDDSEGANPQCDLFAKPSNLSQGLGAMAWTWDGRDYVDRDGNRLTWSQIIEGLRDRSKKRSYLLQPKIRNHPELERVCGKGLASVRIVTGRSRTGELDVLVTSLKMPRGGAVVSNTKQGGLAAMIDPKTGRIFRSHVQHPGGRLEACAVHPDTGEAVDGLVLPHWSDVVTLVRRAHSSLKRVAFVGWDVGITPNGPVLIEANHGFGVHVIQGVANMPLGLTNFARYYNEHYDVADEALELAAEQRTAIDVMLAVRDEFARRLDARHRRKLNSRQRLLFDLAVLARPILKPAKRVASAIDGLRRYGMLAKSKSGLSRARQASDIMRLAHYPRLAPQEYYEYALYMDRGQAADYMPRDTWWRLIEGLLDASGADTSVIDDKRATYRHLVRANLNTVPHVAEFDHGEIMPGTWTPGQPLPDGDLFSKTARGARGEGARRWLRTDDGRFRTDDGSVVDEEELIRRLLEQSRKDAVVLQPRIRNHAELRKLTGETLSSVRLITMRPPHGSAEYFTGIISLPVGDVRASNARFGSIFVAIDGESGRLGHGTNSATPQMADTILRHPVTKKRIEGFQLPDWHEAVRLAERAHNSIPDIPMIGWDVALTDFGPTILEGNIRASCHCIQGYGRPPLGATRFPELFLDYFRNATTPRIPEDVSAAYAFTT